MLTFLKSFVDSLFTVHAGLTMYTSSFKCHVRLPCGTSDLPAKAIVLNMMQFNGTITQTPRSIELLEGF